MPARRSLKCQGTILGHMTGNDDTANRHDSEAPEARPEVSPAHPRGAFDALRGKCWVRDDRIPFLAPQARAQLLPASPGSPTRTVFACWGGSRFWLAGEVQRRARFRKLTA